MPWQEVSTVSLRQEFIRLVQQKSVSVSELCRRYSVSRKTGYKWFGRYRREGPASLPDRSRRPHQYPGRTPAGLEAVLVALRQQHPAWGARKLRRRLQTLGEAPVPACSTVTAILHRYGLIAPEGPGGRPPWVRFEHPAPNSLWRWTSRDRCGRWPGAATHWGSSTTTPASTSAGARSPTSRRPGSRRRSRRPSAATACQRGTLPTPQAPVTWLCPPRGWGIFNRHKWGIYHRR